MRISDWSSDVCSSDLVPAAWPLNVPSPFGYVSAGWNGCSRGPCSRFACACSELTYGCALSWAMSICGLRHGWNTRKLRSEEHTSELQSLMRISYAVFCLKTKKNTHKTARNE